MNNGILATSSYPSVGNAWASVAASSTAPYQVLGFSGGSSLNAATVQLFFGSTLKATIYAASGVSASEQYGGLGPFSAANEKVAVRTTAASGLSIHVSANLLYRIVL